MISPSKSTWSFLVTLFTLRSLLNCDIVASEASAAPSANMTSAEVSMGFSPGMYGVHENLDVNGHFEKHDHGRYMYAWSDWDIYVDLHPESCQVSIKVEPGSYDGIVPVGQQIVSDLNDYLGVSQVFIVVRWDQCPTPAPTTSLPVEAS